MNAIPDLTEIERARILAKTARFAPPPARTAYFCARRRPGRVLRVSRMAQPRGFVEAPATAST